MKASLLDASGDPRVSDVANRFAGFLHYRRHGPDSGQSAAIAEGWAKAPGEILGWLNADDILMPGALAEARAVFLSEPALDMACGHSVIIDEQQRMTGYQWTVEPPGPRILEANVISQPSCFFRRAACEKAGGLDESLHYTMDWELWIRLFRSGAKATFIDRPLSMVMWGEGTKTAAFNMARRDELRRIIDAHAPAEKRRKIYRAFAIHNLMSRINLPAFTRMIERGRASVFGLGADGAIAPGARLYLAHYDAEPKKGVAIALSSGAEELGVRSSEAARTSVIGATEVHVEFAQPLPPGRLTVVTLEPHEDARLRFRFAAWR